jgi:hypothetical protein
LGVLFQNICNCFGFEIHGNKDLSHGSIENYPRNCIIDSYRKNTFHWRGPAQRVVYALVSLLPSVSSPPSSNIPVTLDHEPWLLTKAVATKMEEDKTRQETSNEGRQEERRLRGLGAEN